MFGFGVDKKNNLLDLVYPVGSIYFSVNSVSPENLFGGQWEAIEGRFLLGSNEAFTLGDTGGEVEHTLTIAELPNHNHDKIYIDKTDDYDIRYKNWEEVSFGGYSVGFTLNEANHSNFRTSYTGGSQPHSNMPPYLVVNIWKRIA